MLRPLKRAVWRSTALLGRILRREGVPILTYHSIDDSGSLISVAPRAFEWQMQYLERAGLRSLPLREYVDRLAAGDLPRRGAFVITFDDAFKNVLDVALPILRRHGFTATVFVPTEHVGKPAPWIMRPGLPHLPLMGWAELAELGAHGFDIQSHSCTHPFLTSLPAEELEREVTASRREIEQRLGRPADLFCYPYGDLDDRVIDVLRRHGCRGAVTLEFGVNRPGSDPLRLRRVGSAHFTEPAALEACLSGCYAPLVNLRRRLRARGQEHDPRRLPGV